MNDKIHTYLALRLRAIEAANAHNIELEDRLLEELDAIWLGMTLVERQYAALQRPALSELTSEGAPEGQVQVKCVSVEDPVSIYVEVLSSISLNVLFSRFKNTASSYRHLESVTTTRTNATEQGFLAACN